MLSDGDVQVEVGIAALNVNAHLHHSHPRLIKGIGLIAPGRGNQVIRPRLKLHWGWGAVLIYLNWFKNTESGQVAIDCFKSRAITTWYP